MKTDSTATKKRSAIAAGTPPAKANGHSSTAVGRKPALSNTAAPSPRAWVAVSRAALLHNLDIVRALAGASQVMAVVKADAYGLGMVSVASILQSAGVRAFAVVSLDEALELRRHGIEDQILILGHLPPRDGLEEAAAKRLDVSISNAGETAEVEAFVAGRRGKLCGQVQVDVGMTRLGMPPAQVVPQIHRLRQCPRLTLTGLYAHPAATDRDGLAVANAEFLKVIRSVATLPKHGMATHFANTAGLISRVGRDVHDFVRIGMALYGGAPACNLAGAAGWQAVATLHSRIVQLQEVPSGTGISYRSIFVTRRTSRIATVPVGYADGIPLSLSNALTATIRGVTAPQVGAVTMNFTMFDVTDVPGVKLNDEVSLFGEASDCHRLAQAARSTVYELLARLGPGLPRIVV